MTQLAIKGHETRGEEIIKLLQMLGGNNTFMYYGDDDEDYYYIDNSDEINVVFGSKECIIGYTTFTLEEFLEKYPYKVGDKVLFGDIDNIVWEIESMQWVNNEIKYIIRDNNKSRLCDIKAEHLLPYKEEHIECSDKRHKGNCTIGYIQELGSRDMELIIPYNQEIVIENGRYILRDKKPKYPKTYAECCKIVNASIFVSLVYNLTDGEGYSHDVDNLKIYDNIRRLKICRDAYWKIAGEQMGLDGPWEPTMETVYCISRNNNVMKCSYRGGKSNILEFPTPEMRDTFYENFKQLIEQCKELL